MLGGFGVKGLVLKVEGFGRTQSCAQKRHASSAKVECPKVGSSSPIAVGWVLESGVLTCIGAKLRLGFGCL